MDLFMNFKEDLRNHLDFASGKEEWFDISFLFFFYVLPNIFFVRLRVITVRWGTNLW